MSDHIGYSTISDHAKCQMEFEFDELKIAHDNELSDAIERFKTKVLVTIATMQLIASQDTLDAMDVLIDKINAF